jgi:nucleoside-diphosphate-sugar epimerase
MHRKVLITGITGFLGSHIAEKYINNGYQVIGLKRQSSDIYRCSKFENKVTWINVESENWKEKIKQNNPQIFIHSAWNGVEANSRLQWSSQLTNLNFLLELLEMARELKISKFIGLGSQAEYGSFFDKVNENYPTEPNTAYGIVKLMALNLIKCYCTEYKVSWYWLRLFPVFGENEGVNWLIPSVIRNIVDGKSMELTPGHQKYAYMYVKDLAKCVYQLSDERIDNSKSGVYNLSSNHSVTLKEIIEYIRDSINPEVKLNFGALNYRPYQSMHIEGDMSKFSENIGKIVFSDFYAMLNNTIQFYIEKYKC